MGLAMAYTRRVACAVALIFAFATAAWPDAQSADEHTQVSLVLLLSVYAVWRFTRAGMADRRLLLLAGAASGVSVITRYDAAIFVPVIAVWLAALRGRQIERLREVLTDL